MGSIDAYHVLQHVGEGSFGTVYKARRKFTGSIVAMKFITKKNKSMRDIKNLRSEIAILTSLRHEHIISLLDSFETGNEFVVVMEFAQGVLFDILEDERTLPEHIIRRIAQQLVQALHFLHSNRIMHRDMKPQNVLIAHDGVVKLADFGFARSMQENTNILSSIKGTPLYMAPELVQELWYNHTADLWSLGCVLYELAAGRPPFYTTNIYALVNQIIKDDIVFPDNLSPELTDLLRGLLKKKPEDRLDWQSGLLQHPFLKETAEDIAARRVRQAEADFARDRTAVLRCAPGGDFSVAALSLPQSRGMSATLAAPTDTSDSIILALTTALSDDNLSAMHSAAAAASMAAALCDGYVYVAAASASPLRAGTLLGPLVRGSALSCVVHALAATANVVTSHRVSREEWAEVVAGLDAAVAAAASGSEVSAGRGASAAARGRVSAWGAAATPTHSARTVRSAGRGAVKPAEGRVPEDMIANMIGDTLDRGAAAVAVSAVRLLAALVHPIEGPILRPFPCPNGLRTRSTIDAADPSESDAAVQAIFASNGEGGEGKDSAPPDPAYMIRTVVGRALTSSPEALGALASMAFAEAGVGGVLRAHAVVKPDKAPPGGLPSGAALAHTLAPPASTTTPSGVPQAAAAEGGSAAPDSIASPLVLLPSAPPCDASGVPIVLSVGSIKSPTTDATAPTIDVDASAAAVAVASLRVLLQCVRCDAADAATLVAHPGVRSGLDNAVTTLSTVGAAPLLRAVVAVYVSEATALLLLLMASLLVPPYCALPPMASITAAYAASNIPRDPFGTEDGATVSPSDGAASTAGGSGVDTAPSAPALPPWPGVLWSIPYSAASAFIFTSSALFVCARKDFWLRGGALAALSATVAVAASGICPVAPPPVKSTDGAALGAEEGGVTLIEPRTFASPSGRGGGGGGGGGGGEGGGAGSPRGDQARSDRGAVAVHSMSAPAAGLSDAAAVLAYVQPLLQSLTTSATPLSSSSRHRNVVATSVLAACAEFVQHARLYATVAYSRIEGTSFGLPDVGLLDGVVVLLRSCLLHTGLGVVVPAKGVNGDETVVEGSGAGSQSPAGGGGAELLWKDKGAWPAFVDNVLRVFDPKTDLSPRLVPDLLDMLAGASYTHPPFAGSFSSTTLSSAVVKLVSYNMLTAVLQWPRPRGGGVAGVARLTFAFVAAVLSAAAAPAVGGDAALSEKGRQVLVHAMLNAATASHLATALSVLPVTAWRGPVALLARLVLFSSHFAQHFIQGGGLKEHLLARTLLPSAPTSVQTDVVTVLAHIARSRADHYEALDQGGVASVTFALLQSKSDVLRAKASNLVGNLFKHSPYFYTRVSKALLHQLIEHLRDPAPAVRKFAAFAIGNAAFHSSALYADLAPAIQPLTDLLEDSDEKARANAAGALGNLVRNGRQLEGELVSLGVVERLLSMLKSDGALAGRIAVFALGSFAASPVRVRIL